MDEEADFLAAIKEEPDNDTRRLVFADWLQDRGRMEDDFKQREAVFVNRIRRKPDDDKLKLELAEFYKSREGSIPCPCAHLEVGDLVKHANSNGLHCASGVYPFAIVVSKKPFALVSQEGDMLWTTTISPDRVVKIAKATDTKKAFERWERDKHNDVSKARCQWCLGTDLVSNGRAHQAELIEVQIKDPKDIRAAQLTAWHWSRWFPYDWITSTEQEEYMRTDNPLFFPLLFLEKGFITSASLTYEQCCDQLDFIKEHPKVALERVRIATWPAGAYIVDHSSAPTYLTRECYRVYWGDEEEESYTEVRLDSWPHTNRVILRKALSIRFSSNLGDPPGSIPLEFDLSLIDDALRAQETPSQRAYRESVDFRYYE